MSFVDEDGRTGHGRSVPSSPGFRVRSATVADAEGVAARFGQCVGGSMDEHRHGFAQELAGARTSDLLLVAEAEGSIVGFARARYFAPPPRTSSNTAPAGWYLLGVNTLPSYRRQGVGADLTRVRLQWIAERAVEVFYFAAEENSASRALHERFGFREVSRDVEYPGALACAGGRRRLYRLGLNE